jgi:Flp pilus assembly protein TadD
MYALSLLYTNTCNAQALYKTEQGKELYAEAQSAFKAKSYGSAINLMRYCVGEEPDNPFFHCELARAYMLNANLGMAAFLVEKAIELPTADEATFAFAATVHTQAASFDNARKVLNKGLELFPNSGMLYEAKGNLYFIFEKDEDALKFWEKGIKKDPSFPANYYHLAKQEITVNENIVKTILLAETYVLMEPMSVRSNEMKKLLYDAYNRMFQAMYNGNDIAKGLSGKASASRGSLQKSLCQVYENNKYMLVGGLTDNNIIMFRMRFLLDWTNAYKDTYPLAMVSHLQTLVAEGHFETYNRWIFGNLMNEERFSHWYAENADSYQNFIKYIAEHKLVPQNGQYYF